MSDLPGRLRFFLRSRCGSLKAAFGAMDAQDQGKLTQQDFDIGLKKLGFTEDARSVFATLQEAAGSGEITLRTFVSGMMLGDADETTKVFPISSTTPRCNSDSHLQPTLLPRPPHASTGAPMPVKQLGARASSQGPTVEKASNTEARIKHLEEQLIMEQSQRLETELRLTEYLHRAISEEFDVIKRELRQEQAERRALKAELQDLRSKITGASLTQGADAMNSMNRLKILEGKIARMGSDDDGKASTTKSLTLDACSIHSENLESSTPGVPRGSGLSPRTLRQENLKLREENLSLREQAVEAREREKRQRSVTRDVDSSQRMESPAVPENRSRAASPCGQAMQAPPRPDVAQSPPRHLMGKGMESPPRQTMGKGMGRQLPSGLPHSWKGAGLSARKGTTVSAYS